MNLNIDEKKKLLFEKEKHNEITEFFSKVNDMSDNELEYILNLYISLDSLVPIDKNFNIFEPFFKHVDKILNSKEDINYNYCILVCTILINFIINSKQKSYFLLWHAYFFRGKSYLRAYDYNKAIKDTTLSLKLVENNDDLRFKYLTSLWQIAICYSYIGLQFEALELYHALSRNYRFYKNNICRICCLYNIALLFKRVDSIKTLKKYLEKT